MKNKSEFLSKSIVKLLHYRVEQEEASARLYLSMSFWLINTGYIGAGKLFKQYSDEELVHADKAKNMLLANGIKPLTPVLKEPKEAFESLPAIVEAAFNHEKAITKQCYSLTKAAFDEDNYMVAQLGLWFCNEQAEELNKIQKLLNRIAIFGKDKDALRELDNEMGAIAN